MTPRELAMAFEAAVWRQQRERERDLWLAWHVAAFGKSARLPSLKELLHPGETKALSADEKAERQAEFEELTRRMGKRDGG